MHTPLPEYAPVLPLEESGFYEFPLRPTEAQARWLQAHYPVPGTDTVEYAPFPLSGVQVRQEIWQESLLFSPLLPSPMAIELSGLPESALEALGRYTPGEVIPDGWPEDAPNRAWLQPDSARIITYPNGEYRFGFCFQSKSPLRHFGRRIEDALARWSAADFAADTLEEDLNHIRTELHRFLQSLSAFYNDVRGDGPAFPPAPTVAPESRTRTPRPTSRRLRN